VSWNSSTLGSVCDLINRGIAPSYVDDGGILVLNQKCIRNHTVNYELSRRHDSLKKPVKEERLIRAGDVLVNSTGTGTLGRVALVVREPLEPTTVDTHITIVRPKKGIFDKSFFGLMLISIEEKIKQAGEGSVGQTELSRAKLRDEFVVSYPSDISIQKKVADKLYAIFTEIEKATAAAEANAKNAESGFDSFLTESLLQLNISSSQTTLDNLCERITVGYVGRMKDEYISDGIPFLRSQNIRPFSINLTDVMYIGAEFHKSIMKSTLKPGDVAIVRTGYPGTAAVIPATLGIANCSDLVIFTPKKELNPYFLEIFFNSPYGKSLVLGKIVGAAQKHFNVSSAKKVPFPVLDLSVQNQFVEKTKDVRRHFDNLKSAYLKKVVSLREFKHSILKQAFAGELVKE
jgi:type I restriction enzyme S subunit